jgi:hypothetical protein
MSAEKFEAFLVELYVDESSRTKFLADPRAEALAAGLSDAESESLAAMDFVGLELASRSFGAKRAGHSTKLRRSCLAGWWNRRKRLPRPSS